MEQVLVDCSSVTWQDMLKNLEHRLYDTIDLVFVLGDACLPADSPESYPSREAPTFRAGLDKGIDLFHRDEPGTVVVNGFEDGLDIGRVDVRQGPTVVGTWSECWIRRAGTGRPGWGR